MSVFKKIFGTLKGIGKGAATAGLPLLASTNPLIAIGVMLAATTIGGILKAEVQHGESSGPTKRKQVISETLPSVIRMIESLIGKDLNEDQIAAGVGQVVDGFVAVLNGIRTKAPARVNSLP